MKNLCEFITVNNAKKLQWKPIFFHCSTSDDLETLQALKSQKSIIQVNDTIRDQLTSLLLNENFNKHLSADDINHEINKRYNNNPPEYYGVWIFYPWSNRLIHTLNKNEFIKIRTNRNLYKISLLEQQVLATKKVGIVGLSVGQSIALILALERSIGQIRLADFDTLEISNMNRLRSGLHNLGVPKVYIAAREIFEIDPYLDVICYPEGITHNNINDFLLGNGKLDLLVDECDSLEIKFELRYQARNNKIPVIMDTSDRGLLDIERFDLEANRPLFHGRIVELSKETLIRMNPSEKLAAILKIVNYNHISERGRLSLNEIGKSLKTWPQIASSVNLGGSIGADTARRILLGEAVKSGRYYVDLNRIINSDLSFSNLNIPDAIKFLS